MVQIDVPVAFGIGSFFADAANRQLASGRAEYYYRTFAANNIFGGPVGLPFGSALGP